MAGGLRGRSAVGKVTEFSPEPFREPKRVAMELAFKAYRLMVSV